MNNTAILEKEINTVTTDYIYHEAIRNLLLLLLSQTEQQQSEKFPFHLHEDILEIKNSVQNYILKIEDILNGEKEEKSAALEHCIALKEKITSIYETIYYYFTNWNIPFTLISDEIAIRKYKEEKIADKKLEFAMFYMDCTSFLEDAHTISEQKKYMGQLLKCFPLRIARETYFDLLKKSLDSAFANESEKAIQLSLKTVQKTYALEKFEGYEKYFPKIAQFIASKKEIEPSKMDDETLSKQYHDFNIVFESLKQIEDYFECMFHDVNSLIILFYLNYTFDELTEGDFAYGDLYHAVCELSDGTLEQSDSVFYLDTLKKELEHTAEKVIDETNERNQKRQQLLEKVNDFFDFSKDTHKIIASAQFLYACFCEELNQEIFSYHLDDETNSPASGQIKQKMFDEFIQFLKQYVSPLPTPMKKTTMMLLLSSLPIDWTVSDSLDYIAYTLENLGEFEHQALILDKVGMVFADNGYQYKTEADSEQECDCGHYHHHHHHDHHDHCDCGHDHHHHHK